MEYNGGRGSLEGVGREASAVGHGRCEAGEAGCRCRRGHHAGAMSVLPSMAPEEVQQNHRGGKRGGKEGEGGGPTGAKLSFYVAFEGPLMEKWMECQIRKQT